MPDELLFVVQFEISMFDIIDDNRIVHALAGEIFAIRMDCSRRNCMHIRFLDVFSHNRDSKFPNVNFLVVRCRNKPFAIVYERQTVN